MFGFLEREKKMIHVRRLVPTCEGRRLFEHPAISHALCPLYSSAICSLNVLVHDNGNKNEEVNFNTLFHSCNTLLHAKCLHALLVVSGKAEGIFMSTRLINLYANIGDVSMSRRTFDKISNKDTYIWNSMISVYVRSGCYHEAVNCFYESLLAFGVRPDFYTFPPVLKACQNLVDGKKFHCWVLKMGLEWDVYVAASLIHMYCRFQLVDSAHKLFDDMPSRDMGSWNAMISGLCNHGNAMEALALLDELMLEGINMDSITVASILPICAQLNDLLSAMLIHLYVIKHGLEFELFVSNALINIYAKFGRLELAQKVFDEMPVRDLVSWNSIIASYEQNDDALAALKLFKEMQAVGFRPDVLTLVSLASIVALFGDCGNCRPIHAFVVRRGWLMEDVVIGNAVVDMYAKLGVVDSARKVFDEIPVKDVISWNTLITGYAQNGLGSEAIEAYQMMQVEEEMVPNQGTWVSILPAYSIVGALREGTKIHGRVIKNNLFLDLFVGTCLIDMYGKCGRLTDAMSLFYQVPHNSVVPWNAVISCHGIHGHGEQALHLFRKMRDKGVGPDHVTFVSLLSACSHSGLLDQGQWCFDMMQKVYGIKPSLKHYGCMVDLFGRAGHLTRAYDFVKNMPIRPDASIWGTLLGACRIHGNAELGSFASDRLFKLDGDNVGYYVLMSNIYANVGKWEGVDKVRSAARDRGLKKTPGWSSIELENKLHTFYTGNHTHPQSEEIYNELSALTARMKILGYAPDYGFVLQDVEEDEKEQILMSHSERLAIAFGILNMPPKSSIQIFKNLRVCGDCHNATKYISKITEREIIVRDSNRFHHFKDGLCSCGDYW